MGTGLFNEDAAKVEHSIIFLVVTGVAIHFFAKYASVSLDLTSFMVFAGMCFAGYFTLKTAKDILNMIEDRKQAAYEAVKADMMIVSPAIFSKTSKHSTFSKL